AEIEYKDKRSPSIYITYDVKDGKGLLDEGTKFIIWTTTPWTIPASLGVTLHPDIEYEVIAVNGEKYVVAHDLVESLEEELKWEQVAFILLQDMGKKTFIQPRAMALKHYVRWMRKVFLQTKLPGLKVCFTTKQTN